MGRIFLSVLFLLPVGGEDLWREVRAQGRTNFHELDML